MTVITVTPYLIVGVLLFRKSDKASATNTPDKKVR